MTLREFCTGPSEVIAPLIYWPATIFSSNLSRSSSTYNLVKCAHKLDGRSFFRASVVGFIAVNSLKSEWQHDDGLLQNLHFLSVLHYQWNHLEVHTIFAVFHWKQDWFHQATPISPILWHQLEPLLQKQTPDLCHMQPFAFQIYLLGAWIASTVRLVPPYSSFFSPLSHWIILDLVWCITVI